MRVIGDIISMESEDASKWTLKFIDLGVLDKIHKILVGKENGSDSANKRRQKICWMVSNMVASNDRFDQIMDALRGHQLFEVILETFKCSPFVIREEAAYIILNIIANCSSLKKVDDIFESHFSSIVPALFGLFRYSHDTEGRSDNFAVAILEGMEHLLRMGQRVNNYKHSLQALKCSGMDTLESMQSESNGLMLRQRIKDVMALLKEQQDRHQKLLLVQCGWNICNKTKYIMEYVASSVNSKDCDLSSSYSRVQKHKFYRCKGCNSVVYCSKHCQKWHWKNGHKRRCNKFA